MTPHDFVWLLVIVSLLALCGVVAWLFHWFVLDWRYWFQRTPEDLPGPVERVERPDGSRAGEHQIVLDEWEQLDPDQAADQLIAEWHDEPLERTVTGDVWDQWWAGIDGLERECMLTHDWYLREEALWAELKAETKELCAA